METGTSGNETTDVLSAEPPAFSAEQAAEIAGATFGLHGTASGLDSERDQNFLITEAEGGGRAVLKISNASEPAGVVEMEIAAALHAKRADPELPIALPRQVPDATAAGPAAYRAAAEGADGSSHHVRVYDFMPGDAGTDPLALGEAELWDFGRVLARLGRSLRGFFHPAAGRQLLWDIQHVAELRPLAARVADHERRELLERTIDRFEQRVLPRWPQLRSQVIHGDLALNNVTMSPELEITGILDFGDMSHTALMADITSAWASIAWAHRGDELFRAAGALLDGYRSVTPLEQLEVELLPELFAARAAACASISAMRVAENPDNEYIAGFDTHAWPLLELWDELGPEETARRFGFRSFTKAKPIDELLSRRSAALGSALMAPTYQRPLHMVRAEGVWMTDAGGNRYLDAYNNVPVVGHSHPRVVEALANQARTLNTNMRYLHEGVIELAERLLASMPAEAGLDTVMFVNSGSEANDLAWRIATAYTGNGGGLSSTYAYHGISNVIADLSPEGSSAPMAANVERFPPPGADGSGPAGGYAEAIARLAHRGVEPAAVFIDGAFTSDGVFPPDPAYLEQILALTHDAGGLYVADEVQVGHGRIGEALWSFAASGIKPDMVTMGKPMGNGYPIAALVTRREIVDRFARLREFFSTFGGNPPGAVTALTVLDVIEDEGLAARAARVGGELRAGIEQVASGHAGVAAVRGWGQLTGVELAAADGSPDPALADRIKNGMRDRGVLISTTGRHDHVLKIRPPLPFDSQHAELLCSALTEVLSEVG